MRQKPLDHQPAEVVGHRRAVPSPVDGPELGRAAGPTAARITGDIGLKTVQPTVQIEGAGVDTFLGAAVVPGPGFDAGPRSGMRFPAAKAAALVGDHRVRRAVDLQDVHRVGRRTALVGAGQAGHGGDDPRTVVGHSVGHEPAIRVAEQRDPGVVDGIVGLDGVDEPGEVGNVIHVAGKKITAGARRVPETTPSLARFLGAVGGHQDETVVVHQSAEVEVRVLLRAAGGVAVQQQDQRRRRLAIVAGRHVHR